MTKYALRLAGVGLSLFCATSAQAQIAQVAYGSLSGTQSVSFGGVPGGAAPGTNYDNILVVNGVAFGEHFEGQTVTANGNYDQINGNPTNGLTLVAGASGHNVSVFQAPPGPVLSGLGTLGFPASDAIGEGAFSILFGSDQSEFGLVLTGSDGGPAYLGFYRADGSLIQLLSFSGLPLVSSLGFQRDGGVHDIRGVSYWNADVTGMGLAAIRFDVPSAVPEPSTWAMMLLGFGLIGWTVRRRGRANSGAFAYAGDAKG